MKKKGKLLSAALAIVLAGSLAVGMLPTKDVAAAGKTANMEGFSATLIADPDTSEENQIFNGTPAEDGKIWTDKTVTTGAIYGVPVGEEHFGVALSAMAQTYNTVETSMTTEETKVAYDVVFVLDFSGSMVEDYVGTGNNRVTRAQALVNALNPAIELLMENADNRIGVIQYSGSSNLNDDRATSLLALDHYSTTETDRSNNKVYFEYSNSYIGTPDDAVQNNVGRYVNTGHSVTGGTPTQRGLFDTLDEGFFANGVSHSTDVTRIPVIVLMTDGEAGRASSNYTTLSGGTTYTGTAANGNNNSAVGAYTVLTANYIKDYIEEEYRDIYDYSGILPANEEAVKFYTIGLGITENSWTHFMLNPESGVASNNSTANSMRSTLNTNSTYKNDYDYADEYFGSEDMGEDDLKKAFADIVSDLNVQSQMSSVVNDPVSTEAGGGATGSTVKFTDYLGYKMELKGDSQYLRYGNVNYRFDLTQNTDTVKVYTFSGYDQLGNVVTGPVITKNDTTYTLANVIFKAEWKADETYNGQTGYWVVTLQFPSALMPAYSRENDYSSQGLDPIRMLYEVGLCDDAELARDGLKIDANGKLLSADAAEFAQYVFHSNLYDYSTPKAMTWSEFTPSINNPFYYKTGYVTDATITDGSAEDNAADSKYMRLDVEASSTQLQDVEGTASDISLTNIDLSRWNARATFEYKGNSYTVALTGDNQAGEKWTGTTTIPVTGVTADGEEITQDVNVVIVAEYVESERNYYWDYIQLSSVTIGGKAATVSEGTQENGTASVDTLTVVTQKKVKVTSGELVSVYMELKGDAQNGYYVTDANGNELPVTYNEVQEHYEITLGEDTYYSLAYYKYDDGIKNYKDKELAKGTVARSLVGHFNIDQPTDDSFTLTADNFDDTFSYTASNGKTYKATGVLYPNGNKFGTIGDPTDTTSIPAGTFKVCVDGIKNGLVDVNGKEMIIHFDFIVEEQLLADGKNYVVLDCSYWEAEDTYAVDVAVSDTPDIDVNGNYSYDVSYTIESKHASGEANVTQTDPHFFHSHLDNGQMVGRLGNNGRLAVDITNAYDNAITVKKEWYDRLNGLLDVNSEALKNVSITVGLYQQYSYIDAEGNPVVQDDADGMPFDTVVLNQANGFTYTWAASTLPEYLVASGGDYVLDENGDKVPVTYLVGEVIGASGWMLSGEPEHTTEGNVETFILANVPLAKFVPQVEKVWTVDGQPAAAPEGYKVKIELLANGELVVNANKLDTEHIIEASLTQANESADATLEVKFGTTGLTAQTVANADFAADNTTKNYVFRYDLPVGEVGSGNHADYADITIAISNTGSGDMLSISDATVTYYFTDSAGAVQTAVLRTHRSNLVTSDHTKTATFLMRYSSDDAAVVILDGIVDDQEHEAWKSKLDDWNLPLLAQNNNGDYELIVYSVCETLMVPDGNGGYAEYTPDENGLITVLNADNSVRTVYKANITNTADYSFTVNNDESKTDVSVKKVWIDNDNSYGTRPENITFTLKVGDAVAKDLQGNEIASVTINKPADATGDTNDNIWNGTESVTWTDVPLYNVQGEKITYTVEETIEYAEGQSDEYQITVTEDTSTDAKDFIVTNSLHADPAINYTEMAVEKVWIDDNDAAGKRPDMLYMVLYRTVDGSGDEPQMVPGAEIITLTDNVLTGSWANLAKYNEQGKKYIYSVKEFSSLARTVDEVTGGEESVPGYTDVSTAADKTETKYTFRNQLSDGSISKTVTKQWFDAALANERPANVTVVLSGETTDGEVALNRTDLTVELTAAMNWSYTWSDLPEYSGGKKIDYTVAETKAGTVDVVTDSTNNRLVAGIYEVSVQDDGTGKDFVVKNAVTGETSITVTKEWNVPEGYEIPDVIFEIYGENGVKLSQTLKVTKDALTASVDKLPKYNAKGEEIEYTLKEQAIAESEEYAIDSVIVRDESAGDFVYHAVNTYVDLLRDVTVNKHWVGVSQANTPASITVNLYRHVEGGAEELVKEAVVINKPVGSGSTWSYTFTDLPIYKIGGEESIRLPYIYTVKETKVGDTAVIAGKAGDYTVVESGLNITNTLGGAVEGAELDATKVWDGVAAANIPDSITVELWRNIPGGSLERARDIDHQIVEVITVEKNNYAADATTWGFDFTGVTLPKYDDHGNEYVYTVKETSVTVGTAAASKVTREVVYNADGTGVVGDYTVTLNGLTITNELDGDAKVSYPMIKEWVLGGQDITVPSITVQLKRTANGETENVKQQVLSEDLLKQLDEADTSDTIYIQGTAWFYTFEDLDKFAKDGITEYVYDVEEIKVDDDNVVNGKAGEWLVHHMGNGMITNTLGDNEKQIVIRKTWFGVNVADIPDSITVQLYQYKINDAIAFGQPVTLTKEEHSTTADPTIWKYTYTVPRTYNGSDEYTYYVEELSVTKDGVTINVDRTAKTVGDYSVTDGETTKEKETATVTNTKDNSLKTEYTVTKHWSDVADPAEYTITLQLMQDGTDYNSETTLSATDENVTVSADGMTWTYTFKDLPKYRPDGITQYVYTAKETKISGITVSNGTAGDFHVKYSQQNAAGTVINNTLVTGSATTEHNVQKSWLDQSGQPLTNLPDSITVQLYQTATTGTVAVGEPVVIDADKNWAYTFRNLPKFEADGLTEYGYSVKETYVNDVAVDQNNSTVGDYNVEYDTTQGTTVIKNILKPGAPTRIPVTVEKIWQGVSTANIPGSVTVQLYNGEVAVGEAYKFTSADIQAGWKHEFKDLPKYEADGITQIVYTVREVSISVNDTEAEVTLPVDRRSMTVGNYKVAENGLTITNTLNSAQTVDHQLKKIWEVPQNAALPADGIIVQLMQDGTPYGTGVKLTRDDVTVNGYEWTYTFETLPKYRPDGITEYVYTVKETRVGGADVVNDGTKLTAGDYEITYSSDGSTITNKLVESAIQVEMTKKWIGVAGNNIPEIKVQLLQNGIPYGSPVTLNADTQGVTVTDNTWTYMFDNLPKRSSNNIEYVYTIKELEIGGVAVDNTGNAGDYTVSVSGMAITNELSGIMTDVEGKKIWKDAAKINERPETIIVELYRSVNGSDEYVASQEIGENTAWEFTFSGYDKYDSNGNVYTYFVKEKGEADNRVVYGQNNYEVEYSIDGNLHTIKNTLVDWYEEDINPIVVTKVWKDDSNKLLQRPASIMVTLKRDGQRVDEITLIGSDYTVSGGEVSGGDVSGGNVSGGDISGGDVSDGDAAYKVLNVWTKAFSDRYPMYDEEGALIAYTVEENLIPDYTLESIMGSAAEGFTLTNVYTPGQTTITVYKIWIDNNNALMKRPETLTLKLLQNGAEFMDVVLESNGANTWTETVQVPLVDASGKQYTYTVAEPDTALSGTDYVKSVSGYAVTNTLKGTAAVSGTKNWLNIDPEYRPESITVELWRKAGDASQVPVTYANGNIMTIVTNAAANWKYDFGTLDKYDENGTLYTYIVKETLIDQTPLENTDYQVSSGDGYDIINEIREETKIAVTVKGTKVWVDNNDQYDMRPESITVNLLRDGVKIDSAEVKEAADGTWTYEFKDLPKYDMSNGKLYAYTVTEDTVENYLTVINGYDITNTLDESKIPEPEPDPEPEPEPEPDPEPEPEPEKVDEVPKTGDNFRLMLYLTMLLAGGIGLTGFVQRKRRMKNF